MYNEKHLENGGKPMLFRKKMERAFDYCRYGAKLEDGNILCAKKGIRQPDNKCWRFRYDPCKRIPCKSKALDFSKYDNEDFSL